MRLKATIAIAVALFVVTAAVAATVTISKQTASSTWLGTTQPAVTVAPNLSAPYFVGAAGTTGIVDVTWSTVPNATAYRVWVDGLPNSVVKAEAGATESRRMALDCGVQHRYNVQGLNGQSVGPIAAVPVYFTQTCP